MPGERMFYLPPDISYCGSDIIWKDAAFYAVIVLKGAIRLIIHGVQSVWVKRIWVRFKKHDCPDCKNLLAATKV